MDHPSPCNTNHAKKGETCHLASTSNVDKRCKSLSVFRRVWSGQPTNQQTNKPTNKQTNKKTNSLNDNDSIFSPYSCSKVPMVHWFPQSSAGNGPCDAGRHAPPDAWYAASEVWNFNLCRQWKPPANDLLNADWNSSGFRHHCPQQNFEFNVTPKGHEMHAKFQKKHSYSKGDSSEAKWSHTKKRTNFNEIMCEFLDEQIEAHNESTWSGEQDLGKKQHPTI